MNKLFMSSLACLTIGAFASPLALAGPKVEEIQGRQNIQSNQIQQGVDSGKLNEKDENKLIQGQNKIEKQAHKDLSDDKMTRREYHKLEHMQNKESKDIESKEAKDENTQLKSH